MKKPNLKKIHFILFLVTAVVTTFNNCSDVAFENAQEPTSLKNIDNIETTETEVNAENIETVADLCESKEVKSLKQRLNFAKTQNTCDWGIDGNLEKRNGYFQARIEQTQKLNLPKGAVICDAQFDIPQQKMIYDDHILIAMNDVVLASTYDFDGILEQKAFSYIYDWKNIAGILWEKNREVFGDNSYCLGKDEFNSQCSWPETDTNGEIMLQFPFEVIQSVSAQTLSKTEYEIKVVSIGDNDDLDCEHSAIEFDMDIKYVIK